MALTKLNYTGQGTVPIASIPTITGAKMPAGSVLQTVHQPLNLTSGSTSGSSSFATYITKAITPSSASSKILIISTINAYVVYSGGYDGPQSSSRLLRDSTHIAGNNFFHARVNVNAAKYHATDQNISFLDSPNTTNAVTYNLQSRYQAGSSITLYNGYLTLMEIAG